MVDPFLDPLDVSPVKRRIFPVLYQGPNLPPGFEAPSEFDQLLAKEIDGKPTPILTKDALRIPKTSATPLPAQSPVQSVPPSIQPFEKSPPSVPEQIVPTLGSDVKNLRVDARPILSQEIRSPRNLRELLNQGNQPSKLERTDSAEKNTTTPLVSITVENADKPQESQIVPETVLYSVKPNDTLSGIVAAAMRQREIPFSTRDIYNAVDTIANANGIRNPNLIYAGQKIDLSSIFNQPVLAKSEPSDRTPMSGDLQVPVLGRLTSGFGRRIHPILKHEHFHTGIDVAVDEGSPVNPLKPGRVISSGFQSGFGQTVRIDHGDGDETIYAHLSERFVRPGDRVERGVSIGLSGNSGRSTGPHLHFEIRRDGEPIDPLSVLPLEAIQRPPDRTGEIASGPTPNETD